MATIATKEQKENVKRWCKALESGEYLQDKDALKTQSGYCCIGVLQELFGTTPMKTGDAELETVQPLDEQVYELTGLSPENCEHFASLNDTDYSFKEIANSIRREFGIKE